MKGHPCRCRRDQPDGVWRTGHQELGPRCLWVGQVDTFRFHGGGCDLEARVDTAVAAHMPQPPVSVDCGGLFSGDPFLSKGFRGTGNSLTCFSFFVHTHSLLVCSNLLIPTDHSALQSLCGEEL